MSTNSHINDLIRVSSRLIAVLEREVELLRAAQPSELEAL